MRLTAPKCVLACMCAHRSDGWMNRPSVCENTPSGLPLSSLLQRAHKPCGRTNTHLHMHTELYSLQCTNAWISTFVHARRARIQAAEPNLNYLNMSWKQKNIAAVSSHEHTHTHRSFLSSKAETWFLDLPSDSLKMGDRQIYKLNCNLYFSPFFAFFLNKTTPPLFLIRTKT